ncbi:MAG: hypothetical protein MPK06_05400 [Alphaproteobacteria bacterium]|nr:hypothetical protein [Alphaproteobacteria bacterium]MDA8003944.1 hypothetical protein [Alphaproteobacteria bacterium]MDA8005957.1 hypothetical protein [Alphaproteobacteria bacterium]MDA8013237.1 hypothetical protein [Alphaproteobacteria bacterium]
MNRLLDTEVCNYIIQTGSQDFLNSLEDRMTEEGSTLYISVITYQYLLRSAHERSEPVRGDLLERIRSFRERFLEVAEWTIECAEKFVETDIKLGGGGALDSTMVIAHALVLDAVLVTNKGPYPKLSDLKTEKW